MAFVPFCCDLDRGLVVVRFDPVGGRDLIDPVEAIKPVACHFQNPNLSVADATSFSFVTTVTRFGFIGIP